MTIITVTCCNIQGKGSTLILILFFSFKDLLREITDTKVNTIAFMQKHNILKKSLRCPGPFFKGKRQGGCNQPMLLKETNDSKDKFVWRCRKAHTVLDGAKKYCLKDVKVSVRNESWLTDTKISLEIVLEIIYLWSQGFSNTEIQHELKLSNKTVCEWGTFIRDCCSCIVMDHSEPIGGEGIHVEIDESKFGKRKYHRGHRVEGQWVFGGREKDNKGRIFMIPVANRKKETLIKLIKKWIKPGSIIHSDCWKAYATLNKIGYKHVTVNHSKEFVNKETGACTNKIECDWRHAKVHMPRYGTHLGQHAGYLAEFMWRRKNHDKDKFLELLKDMNSTYELKYLSSLPKK